VSNIPTPFVGGTDSPRRGSDEEKGLQPPYAPVSDAVTEIEAAAPLADEQTDHEEPLPVVIDDLDEEDLLPDMSTEGEEIAIEGATYDLDWPEPLLETPSAQAGTTTEPELAPAADAPVMGEPSVAGARAEMPDFLLGPDSGDAAEPLAGPVSAAPVVASKEELVEMALTLQKGALGGPIRALVADLSVYTPEIAVPRAFAAGYLAARKEREK